jgi:hypothetical protein
MEQISSIRKIKAQHFLVEDRGRFIKATILKQLPRSHCKRSGLCRKKGRGEEELRSREKTLKQTIKDGDVE